MNPLNQPTVSRSEFRRALNLHCHKELGVGYSDLPDIVCIDDHWYEGMDEKDAIIALEGIIEDFKDELADPYKPIHTVNAPTYTSIDE